jgi:hypothetical protein
MENDEQLARTFTQIAAILQIAHADAIGARRSQVLSDKGNAAIFKATAGWAPTAEIEKAVVGSKALSRSTLFVRLNDLADQGLLERRKQGATTEYRSSGIV